MKVQLIGVIFLFVAGSLQAQRNRTFSFSPMARETVRVDGVVVGFGHLKEPEHKQVINGMNIDLLLFSPVIVMYDVKGRGGHEGPDSTRYDYDVPTMLVCNGVNLALGGYVGPVEHNGLSLGVYNICKSVNGVSVVSTYNRVRRLNGLHVACFGSFVHRGNGVHVGASNYAFTMKGLQVGAMNRSQHLAGVQIGLYNRSHSVRGLQLGIVNKNAKRTLPFINF